ncbi:uncharacterized protein LOC127859924 isoform X2 [Dreissena polymorpha]|uniref:uncharacterized protein LOC127859924 isoform X2 n=2 Tax=Dreissena polymorpha TaxID=45954 RepID=UPI002263EDF3|nr:uncharacterized protein LOC127859924 isoform X2 [Dreissena polymorpha]
MLRQASIRSGPPLYVSSSMNRVKFNASVVYEIQSYASAIHYIMAFKLFVDIATGRNLTSASILQLVSNEDKGKRNPRKSDQVHAELRYNSRHVGLSHAEEHADAIWDGDLDSNVEADALPSLGNSSIANIKDEALEESSSMACLLEQVGDVNTSIANSTDEACAKVRDEGIATTIDCVEEIKKTAALCKQDLTKTACIPPQENGLMDILMFHSDIDCLIAHQICEKIKTDLKSDLNVTIEMYEDFAIGRSLLGSIDDIYNQFRWVLFLITPEYVHHGLQNFQGEILLTNLIEENGNKDGRFVPLFYNVEKKDISRKWLNSIGPFNDCDANFTNRIAKRVRKLRSKY